MNKNSVLRVLNLFLFLSVILQATTVIIFSLELKLPFGKILPKIHTFNGFTLLALALFHLSLNWSWVKSVYFPKKKQTV